MYVEPDAPARSRPVYSTCPETNSENSKGLFKRGVLANFEFLIVCGYGMRSFARISSERTSEVDRPQNKNNINGRTEIALRLVRPIEIGHLYT